MALVSLDVEGWKYCKEMHRRISSSILVCPHRALVTAIRCCSLWGKQAKLCWQLRTQTPVGHQQANLPAAQPAAAQLRPRGRSAEHAQPFTLHKYVSMLYN